MKIRSPLLRFLAAFLIVAALMAAIDILPLHFGARRMPWGELWAVVRERALRMTLIAASVAGVLSWKGGKSASEKPPTP